MSLVPRRTLAWDCATGNGQAARGLSPHFESVIATDASADQISQAVRLPNVDYRVATAEASGLPDHSVTLVTVAQALHWLDHERFFREVRRVTVSGGVIAAWCYGYCHAGDDIEGALREFENGAVGKYWNDRRHWVIEEYQTIPFPFDEVPSPRVDMHARWTLSQLGDYLGTWSAVTSYRRKTGKDPVPALLAQLAQYWGPKDVERDVVWPLGLRVGRVR